MRIWVERYFAALRLLIGLLMAGMVVLVFGNVVMRYVFNAGITVSEELSRWFFVWMVFLGALIGLRERAHLGLDSLVRALSPQGRRLAFIVSHGLMLLACVLLVQGSWIQTQINLGVPASATGLSVGLFYGIGVVFGLSALPILGHDLLRALLGRMTPEEYIGVRDSEEH